MHERLAEFELADASEIMKILNAAAYKQSNK